MQVFHTNTELDFPTGLLIFTHRSPFMCTSICFNRFFYMPHKSNKGRALRSTFIAVNFDARWVTQFLIKASLFITGELHDFHIRHVISWPFHIKYWYLDPTHNLLPQDAFLGLLRNSCSWAAFISVWESTGRGCSRSKASSGRRPYISIFMAVSVVASRHAVLHCAVRGMGLKGVISFKTRSPRLKWSGRFRAEKMCREMDIGAENAALLDEFIPTELICFLK